MPEFAKSIQVLLERFKLKTLSLNECSLDGQFIDQLGQGLLFNETLHVLNLRDNGIVFKQLRNFIHSLTVNKKLKLRSLDIASN